MHKAMFHQVMERLLMSARADRREICVDPAGLCQGAVSCSAAGSRSAPRKGTSYALVTTRRVVPLCAPSSLGLLMAIAQSLTQRLHQFFIRQGGDFLP